MSKNDEFEKMALEMGGKIVKLSPDNKECLNVFELTDAEEENGNGLYLIKSINWTEYYKRDKYLAPNGHEYVSIIANAGFYEENHAKEIVARSSENAKMIPVTKELLQEAIRQLDKRVEELISAKEYEQRRHEAAMEDLTKKSDEVGAGYVLLDEIADNLGIAIKEDDEIEREM